MSIEMPLISIIIAAYNAQNHIQKCLKSCLEQDYKNIQIILVDDASTDDTMNVAQSLIKQDLRVQCVSNTQNIGTFATRLKGLEYARGEFVAFVDSDDYISPEFCTRMLKTFSNDDIGFAACQYFVEPIGVLRYTCTNLYEATFSSQIWKLYRTKILHDAKALCDRMLSSYDLRGLVCLEDLLFSLFIAPFVQQFRFVASPLYFYADNPQSMTRFYSKNRFLSAARSIMLMDIVLQSPLWNPSQDAKIYMKKLLTHTKYNFYIHQRHAPVLIKLNGDTQELSVYLHALYNAAQFDRPIRCCLRALNYCISFGRIKK